LFQEDYKKDAVQAFCDVRNRRLKLNVEYREGNVLYATLVDPSNDDEDIAKTLIRDGHLMVENRKEKRLQKLVRRTLGSVSLISIHSMTTVLSYCLC
jgi:hypothetical protein